MPRSLTGSLSFGVLLLALLAAAPAQATVRYVTASGTVNATCSQATPCTLEQAVERVAGSGDEVIVGPGTYPTTDGVLIDRPLDVHAADLRARPLISKGPAPNANPAVEIDAPGARLAGIDVIATEVFNTAILANASTTIENLLTRDTGDFGEALYVAGGTTLVRGVMARSSGESATALVFTSGAQGTLRGVTAIATGATPGSFGVSVSGATADARNVIVRGTGGDVQASSNARLTLTSSNFRQSRTLVDVGSSLVEGSGNQTASDPTFFSPADAHERLASVTRNAGTVDALIGAVDLDGHPRVQESAPDIGADELPELTVGAPPAGNLLQNPGAETGPGAANATDVFAPPAWAAAGPLTAVRYGTPDFPSLGESARIGGDAQLFVGGPNTASSQGVQLVDLEPYAGAIDGGRATATLAALLGGFDVDRDAMQVTATFMDAAGTPLGAPLTIGPVTPEDRGGATTLVYRQSGGAVPAGARSAEVRLLATRQDGLYDDASADNVALALATAAAPGGSDRTPPVLSSFSASRTRFAVARAGARIARRRGGGAPPRGTRLRFRLTEAATVRVRVERPRPGRRANGRCVAPRRALRRRPRCTRHVLVGSVSYAASAGAGSVAFSGRIGRRALRPGAYRLVAVATDAAGNASRPRALAIAILRG